MFCLSDLLSHIYLKHTGVNDTSVSFDTRNTPPEMLHAEPELYFQMFGGFFPQMASLCHPKSTMHLGVDLPRAIQNLCTLKFNFVFQTSADQTEITRQLTEQLRQASELGAWIEFSRLAPSSFMVSIELNLGAKMPNAALCSPSWLYGKPTCLYHAPNEDNARTASATLSGCGAAVTTREWHGEYSLIELINSVQHHHNRQLHVIDFDSPLMGDEEAVRALDQLSKSGLLAGQLEFLIIVHPRLLNLIPDHLCHHIGYKLITAPLTSHRLINPKSTLMLPYNLRTNSLVPSHEERLRVMLVEDCNLSRRLMRCYFNESGLEVSDFESGESALANLTEQPHHVVVLDLDLPGINGFEMAQRLRAEPRYSKIPIIGITASRELADYSRCYEFGMNDCIGKPLYLKEVVKRVVSWAKTDTKSELAALSA